MNGAESLVRTMVGAGVDVCFTNPGTSEMHFVAALDQLYDQHIHVCEWFVDRSPSLLGGGRQEQSGTKVLERFRTKRLRGFTPTACKRQDNQGAS